MHRSCEYSPTKEVDYVVTEIITNIDAAQLRKRHCVKVNDVVFCTEWFTIDQDEIIRAEKFVHKQNKER